jgi:hypothetical protein
MSTARVCHAQSRRLRSTLMWFTRDGRLVAFLDHIRMVPRNHFRYFDETMRDVCSIDLCGQLKCHRFERAVSSAHCLSIARPRPRASHDTSFVCMKRSISPHVDTSQKDHVFSRHARGRCGELARTADELRSALADVALSVGSQCYPSWSRVRHSEAGAHGAGDYFAPESVGAHKQRFGRAMRVAGEQFVPVPPSHDA